MEPYQGNRFPFCFALFAKADEREVLSVLNALERRGVRSALPGRREKSAQRRAAATLLFLSPEAVRDKAFLRGVSQAVQAGKPLLTVYLRETELTAGLALQLGQTQAVFKHREPGEEAFFRKLFDAPVLRSLSVTPQQKRVLRRRTLLWALGGALVLTAALLIALNWGHFRAMLPNAPLRRLGVPLNFDGVETLYVYGERTTDEYIPPRYRILADGTRDWVQLGEELIPPGELRTLDDFAWLRNLRELCLCNDPVQSVEPLFSLSQLTLLDLSHDGIRDLDGMGALSKLETLNLAYDPLASLDGVQALTRLRTLNVAYTGVSDLRPLLSLPSLETLYVDAGMLDAVAALGETPFAVVCLDRPVYRFGELLEALKDPAVTDIRIMAPMDIPVRAELTIAPGTVLTGGSTLNNYGTVRVRGVWRMHGCMRMNYGTVLVEDGGVYAGGDGVTVSTGTFRIEPGGRHNLERGSTFSLSGGSYENEGDVYLSDGYALRFLSGAVVNRGVLHLSAADDGGLEIRIPRDRFVNEGTVLYKGRPVSDDMLFGGEQTE